MPLIVSQNELCAKERWLLLDDRRPFGDAIPHVSVIAHGVRFADSPVATLKGFGERKVILCDGAQGYAKKLAIPAHCFRLDFDGFNFVDSDNNPYEKCDTMYFMHDGKLYGAMSAETTPDRAAA